MIGDILEDLINGVGVQVTTLNVNSTEPHMKQLVSLMNQTGQDIVKRAEWSRAFKTETIGPNLNEVALPQDFYKMAESGAINLLQADGYEPVRVIAGPATWRFVQQYQTEQAFAHITDGKIKFAPDTGPGGAEMTYIKKGWLTDGTEYVTDNMQMPIFPEFLLISGVMWRWNRRSGLPYDDLVAEFEANFVAAVNADRGLI